MTWASRAKLFLGLIMVVIIVGILTIVFNQRQSQSASITAFIDAVHYPVGIDYGGTVISSDVKNGDHVTKGEPLFTLQSSSLQADLQRGLLKPNTISYSVTEAGVITLTAAVTGTVTGVSTQAGSFVQAGQVLASIDKAGSLFVSAQYTLSPRDYSRIDTGASVDILLPNQTTVAGRVSSIDVTTVQGTAKTTIKIQSDRLIDGAYNDLVKPGTPVSASLTLRNDGIFAGVEDGVTDFLRKIGL